MKATSTVCPRMPRLTLRLSNVMVHAEGSIQIDQLTCAESQQVVIVSEKFGGVLLLERHRCRTPPFALFAPLGFVDARVFAWSSPTGW